jgi:hypothetical protein
MLIPVITKRQKVAIKTLVSKLNLTEPEEKALYAHYDKAGASELNILEAKEIITALSGEAKKRQIIFTPKKYYGKGERGSQQHITQPQAERIGILKELLGWGDAGLSNFISKQTGKLAAVQMLMNYEAVKVNTGMERVLAWKIVMPVPGSQSPGLKRKYAEIYKTINDASNKQLKTLLESDVKKEAAL